MRRNAIAHWTGAGMTGRGEISTQSGVLADTPYSFTSRFADGKGTNPEELLAAAHADCFMMAAAFELDRAGSVKRVASAVGEGEAVVSQIHGFLAEHPRLTDERQPGAVGDASHAASASPCRSTALQYSPAVINIQRACTSACNTLSIERAKGSPNMTMVFGALTSNTC